MSATTSGGPWTSDKFAPDDTGRQELSPYRVTVGDAVYDQSAFTSDTARRYHNFTSGIGAGKTVAGIMRMAANVQAWNPGETGMIITPTSLGIKNVILPELAKWGFLDSWTYRGPQSEQPGLHAPNGTRILLESADNDRKIERLRGPSVAWFWIDEAALVPEKAWRILVGRLRVGMYRNAWITTTPKGFNWVHDKFVDDGGLDSVNNVLGVPSYANPHLAVDYRRDILDEYEGTFYKQEVEGAFTNFEGLVYRWFDPDEHVVAYEDVPETTDETIYGVDWGGTNPSVILTLVREGDRWYVADEFYERRCTVNDMAGRLDDLEAAYGPGTVYCDPAEPGSIEVLSRAGHRAEQADNDVESGIRNVNGVRDDLRVVETCQATINEFGQYQYKEGRDEPLKENDHAMDALRYALFTHDQGKEAGAFFMEL